MSSLLETTAITQHYYKETKYLMFKGWNLQNRKTPIIYVYNKNNEQLGIIKFYPQWRRFVFEAEHCIFDSLCLNDLIEVLNEQQKCWKDNTNK